MTYILSGGHGGHGHGGHHGGHHGGGGRGRGGRGRGGRGGGWGFPVQYPTQYVDTVIEYVDDGCVLDSKTGKLYCKDPITGRVYTKEALGYVGHGRPGLGPSRQMGGLGAAAAPVRALVPTHLQDGDQLDTSDASHSLAKLYGMTAKEIVAANGVAFNTPAIEAWVMATGGRKQSNGIPVFTSNTVIQLPAGGPRKQVIPGDAGQQKPPKHDDVKESGVGGGLVGVLVALGLAGATLMVLGKK